jgi:hypothetical protein
MGDGLREQVLSYMKRLAEGEVSPAEAADWALGVMKLDSPELRDRKLWRALDQLSGADLLEAPGQYLHGPEDFADWLEEFGAENSD